MTNAATQLCISCILVFSSALTLLCAGFAMLISRDEIMPRSPYKQRLPIRLFDLMLSLLFILAVTGLSLMFNRLPWFFALPTIP